MKAIQDVITEVKGIGPATAELLARHGIESIRDLAGASIPKLVEIPGFNESRARQVLFDARAALKKLDERGESHDVSPVTIPAVSQDFDFADTAESDAQSDTVAKIKKDKKTHKNKEKDKSKHKDKKKKSKQKSSKKAEK
ncbi:MAG: helix-hairpin-helix domain-containing protein [Methylococcales bacterium]